MTTRTAITKAKRGAAFLDAKLGRGWRRKIRRRDLDMRQGLYRWQGDCGCIIAQLYGSYTDGRLDLGVRGRERAASLGFDRSPRVGYAELTEAWLEVLREKA